MKYRIPEGTVIGRRPLRGYSWNRFKTTKEALLTTDDLDISTISFFYFKIPSDEYPRIKVDKADIILEG